MFMKAICLFLSRIKVLIWWIEGLSGLLFTFDYDLWSSVTNSRLRYNTRNKTDQKQIKNRYIRGFTDFRLIFCNFHFRLWREVLFSRHDFDRNYFCDIFDTC